MNSAEITCFLTGISLLLVLASGFGRLTHRLKMPAVLGELLAGIILGPTLLGRLFPEVMGYFFPKTGAIASVYSGFNTLAVLLLLMMAGSKIAISSVIRQGKAAAAVSSFGIVIPFVIGFLFAWKFPEQAAIQPGVKPLFFSLFFATSMSISALPVIAKIFIDLNLMKSQIATVTMPAAVFDDLAGWIIFAMVLELSKTGEIRLHEVAKVCAMTLGFVVVMLVVVRNLIHRFYPTLQKVFGGPLTLCLGFALISGALTEWMGVHALFGAFVAGVALGDSQEITAKTQKSVDQFVSSFFAPLFFGAVGLKVDFISGFNLELVSTILGIACVGKILGCTLAARWGKLSWRNSWAVGFSMNTRGAMEIILGLVAFQNGLIGQSLFVALVVIAILTSVMAGPALVWLLGEESIQAMPAYGMGEIGYSEH